MQSNLTESTTALTDSTRNSFSANVYLSLGCTAGDGQDPSHMSAVNSHKTATMAEPGTHHHLQSQTVPVKSGMVLMSPSRQ